MKDIQPLLVQITQWTSTREDIAGLLLVGSYARGAATDESDVDFVLLTHQSDPYLDYNGWLSAFGHPVKIEPEDWGMVQSRRVFYDNGLEVEFGITIPAWAAVDPVDAGTRRVIADGAQILADREGRLAVLLRAVNTKSTG